jgi:hypothetical protein
MFEYRLAGPGVHPVTPMLQRVAGEGQKTSGGFKRSLIALMFECSLRSLYVLLGVFFMASGGARARSGPAPDPMAARRDRKDDAAWVTLPAGGFQGEAPAWPFEPDNLDEVDMWARLWRMPQAQEWSALDMGDQVALYVRSYLEAAQPEASAGLRTAVLRMAGELGLTIPGMRMLRWQIADAPSAPVVPAKKAARKTSSGDWLKAVTVDGEGT